MNFWIWFGILVLADWVCYGIALFCGFKPTRFLRLMPFSGFYMLAMTVFRRVRA